MKWSSNQVIASILFLFSIFYVYTAFQIPDYIIPRPVDSDLFPKVLGLSMLLLSILLFFEKKKTVEIEEVYQEITEKNEQSEIDQQEQVDIKEVSKFKTPRVQVLVSIIAIAFYIFIFEKLGFVVSTILFTFLMTFYYGYKRHLINIIVAGFVSLSFYFLLTKGLGVYLPTGILPL